MAMSSILARVKNKPGAGISQRGRFAFKPIGLAFGHLHDFRLLGFDQLLRSVQSPLLNVDIFQ